MGSQGWSAVAWSPRHQKEPASPSLEKPSMHVARPLISLVMTLALSRQGPQTIKDCFLMEMTDEGHRRGYESRKDYEDQRNRQARELS